MIERKQIFDIVNVAGPTNVDIMTDRIMELIETDKPKTMTVSEARACAAGSIAFYAPVLIIPDPKPAPVEPDWSNPMDIRRWLDKNMSEWNFRPCLNNHWYAYGMNLGQFTSDGHEEPIEAMRELALRVWKSQQEDAKQ